eukprot:TRINITY_DN12748_c0_g1_i1.p1 TRINITY_DN12748_c0_g1~~TRINITY_DN12748_c0_g1_i1.p1  ORF type:complete len:431 (+),score=113.55 TRINITY_DN12748_c0_g1_i1:36-1328(+)
MHPAPLATAHSTSPLLQRQAGPLEQGWSHRAQALPEPLDVFADFTMGEQNIADAVAPTFEGANEAAAGAPGGEGKPEEADEALPRLRSSISEAGSSHVAHEDLSSPIPHYRVVTNEDLREDKLLMHEQKERGSQLSCKRGGAMSYDVLMELEARQVVRQWTMRHSRPACADPSPNATPPASPSHHAVIPHLNGNATTNKVWLEEIDKQRYMHSAAPDDVGYVHCKVARAKDGRVVMRLASNNAFLAHAWGAKPSGFCAALCGGGVETYMVSRGPEVTDDPQCFVYAMESSGSTCRATPHGQVAKETLVMTRDCLCFCMPDCATSEPRDTAPGVLAKAAANKACCASSAVVRADRVPAQHAGSPEQTAPDFHDAAVASHHPGGAAAMFASPPGNPILAFTQHGGGGADVSYKRPLNGYQAFAAYLAWTTLK